MGENSAKSTAGVAPVKSEFLLQDHVRQLDLNFVAHKDQKKLSRDKDDEDASGEPPKKKLKGQNKHRPRAKRVPKCEKLCFKMGTEGSCPFGDSCCYSHDVAAYLEKKPPDLGEKCYLYETFGKCPYSFSCRFGSQHIKDGKNLVINELWEECKNKDFYLNVLRKDIQKSLRKREYNFQKSDDAMEKFNTLFSKMNWKGAKNNDSSKNKSATCGDIVSGFSKENNMKTDAEKCNNKLSVEVTNEANVAIDNEKCSVEVVSESNLSVDNDKCNNQASAEVTSGTNASSDIGKSNNEISYETEPAVFMAEKKKIDFKDKLYLAPLTTVGNLPFRRICKELGADITCSEMAMGLSLLQGQQSEWALIKRHHTEDLFGIQLCGPHPDVMTRCSQLLSETTSFDFIDLNLGCPLDGIYKMGGGCGLMNRMKKLHGMIYGISSVIDKPLTVKIRTGIGGNENIAHSVIEKIHQWGDRVSLITLHGRSREQRYTKSADWEYINTCAKIAAPIPLFGNGDILSYEDYNRRRNETGVSGVMIARGALIKPWIFKEIKDQTHWDISSSERFDILKKFTNYGLEHWGSDTEGVEKTRRFLLEWLSFLYRYIPVGLLECVPQQINERPPPYFGRDDLETLMASPSCSDWVKISEMLLGSVPENFVFLPKHKANAYK